ERVKKLIWREVYRLLTVREGDKVMRMTALQAELRSQIASAAKGNVPAQRAIIKTVQELEAGLPAAKSESVANARTNKDITDMTDEELMAIVRTAQDDPEVVTC